MYGLNIYMYNYLYKDMLLQRVLSNCLSLASATYAHSKKNKKLLLFTNNLSYFFEHNQVTLNWKKHVSSNRCTHFLDNIKTIICWLGSRTYGFIVLQMLANRFNFKNQSPNMSAMIENNPKFMIQQAKNLMKRPTYQHKPNIDN